MSLIGPIIKIEVKQEYFKKEINVLWVSALNSKNKEVRVLVDSSDFNKIKNALNIWDIPSNEEHVSYLSKEFLKVNKK